MKKILFLLIMLYPCSAWAEKIPDKLAIDCIVGEAANQGDIGMYALASALLNRGTTQGVYGCTAKHLKNEPLSTFKRAEIALNKAKTKRLHTGTHWENIKAFGRPKWSKGMDIVYQYKDHVFFKPKERKISK